MLPYRVDIFGWRTGLKKISMTHALKDHAGLPLGAAKAITDRVLLGEVVTVDLPTRGAAQFLAKQLQELGADAVLQEQDRDLAVPVPGPRAGSTITLYRPVGAKELELIAASDWRAFPPRLPQQPFFYPVLSEAYATHIARDWNTKDEASGFVGYVTQFEVDASFASRYEEHIVGSSDHRELWVPADELAVFNQHLVGQIRVLATFTGGAASVSRPAL